MRSRAKPAVAKAKRQVRKSIACVERSEERALVKITDHTSGKTQTLDLSPWLALGSISTIIIEGFKKHCGTTDKSTTRNAWNNDLSSGFLTFCTEEKRLKNRELTADDLNTKLIAKFVAWLTTKIIEKDGKSKGQPLANGTKSHYLSIVKNVVQMAHSDRTVQRPECVFPTLNWEREDASKRQKTSPLDAQTYKALFLYVAEQSLKIITEVGPLLQQVISIRLKHRPTDISTIKNAAQCCAYILEKHEGHFPERRKLDPETCKLVDEYGYTELRRAVFPQANDLIPLLLLLALFTGYNQQPLSSLALDDIRLTSLFGVQRVSISPPKYRAKGNLQRRSFAKTGETLSPPEVLDFLIMWTSIIREVAPDRIRNQLFLCAIKFREVSGDSIQSLGEPTNGKYELVARSIYNFLKSQFPKYIGTRLMRASFAEQMNVLLNGDLEAVGILLGHSSISVTAGSYRSAQATARDELALAGAMAMRHRLVESNGTVDARPQSTNSDRTAATPGWECLDPLSSPMPGQRNGRLCTAYAQCPACPLGNPSKVKSVALARALQLLERMHEARDELGAISFEKAFGAAFKMLVERHIPSLASPRNLEHARRMTLNPIPRIV